MALSERAKELKRQNLKNWRKQNPERVKKHNEDYWNRRARQLEKTGNHNAESSDKQQSQQIETDNVTDAVTDKLTVTCIECGENFRAKRNDARFCSAKCRQRYNRKQKQ